MRKESASSNLYSTFLLYIYIYIYLYAYLPACIWVVFHIYKKGNKHVARYLMYRDGWLEGCN